VEWLKVEVLSSNPSTAKYMCVYIYIWNRWVELF
jgi:hypothetical protein